MNSPAKFLLVSLPSSISPSKQPNDALTALRNTVTTELGTTSPFPIPELKIGTLDALVQQADDLAKLGASCDVVVKKVGESLRSILQGDEDKIAQQKTVNDKPVDHYLRSFSWNKVKYRADKALSEIIDTLQKEIVSIDSDMKNKFNQYNQLRTNLAALRKKQMGNLSTRSLAPLVDPSLLVQDSEYMESHLVAVPVISSKEFLKSYETLSQMVVPRSAIKVTADDEYILYAVTTFKKYSQEFIHCCRERKWIPRDYTYVRGGKEEEQEEVDRVSSEERAVWGEALRLGRTAWSESVMVWIHVMALRVFVETVLRYGLPLDFVCAIVRTTPKHAKSIKSNLDSKYSYLGGNALGKDKKGRTKKDDTSLSTDAGMGLGDEGEYTAYVFYELDLS
ncbi:MAG: Vacuolar ATP synthase subunit C [Trizodia sp. TS-e1964]|nr:MAG: Vacuolar ATP synthase subunit C [Trizodia sp. TS-e1964]